MKLEEEILKEHSAAQCAAIVARVGSSQKRFDGLFALFLNGEYRIVQRAAWPVSYCVEAHPFLIEPHFERLVKKLQEPNIHDAVKRNTVRLLQHVNIPEIWEGAVMDTCFRFVESPVEAVAIKAFSLTVLGKLAKKYPEIIPELKMIIEDQLPSQTAAFKSRAGKLLEEWKKDQ
ncbi:MAG: hypothetical protein EOO13_17280 [Chitinophagaceae bacterium]|nr:MAG: hypothetical protein EOO13_17280 [Chitinophagaceae bacterium]